MKQFGYVTEVSNEKIKVRVMRESSCGGNCVSCKGCPSEVQLIVCDAYDGAKAGDRVCLSASPKNIVGGAAIGYIMPAVFAICGAIGGFAVFSKDTASVIGAVLGIAVGLILTRLIFAKRKISIKALPIENNLSNK